MQTKIINKLSFKTASAKDSLTVLGRVTGTKLKTTQYGDSVALTGQFQGIADGNKETVFSSPVCYLPELATNMIVAALESNGGAEIEFAFIITKEKNANSPVGYSYGVQPVIEQRDPLAELQAKVFAALPSPVPAAEKPAKNKAETPAA